MSNLTDFANDYHKTAAERERLGIPPLPLDKEQTEALCSLLQEEKLDPGAFVLAGQKDTLSSLMHLLTDRVPPGVTDSSFVKADFLGALLHGELTSPYIQAGDAIRFLGQMGGGANIPHLVKALEAGGEIPAMAVRTLANLILISPLVLTQIARMAEGGNRSAVDLLRIWAEADWFARADGLPDKLTCVVARTTGEINTDFFSPAQEAGTRDDIPLHALTMLSTSPHDKGFLKRVEELKAAHPGLPVLFAGDVVGTGSSRKSASNSLVWWIGVDIPNTPNKRRGGVVMASKIAPIFFNTLRGCGAVPVRCQAGALVEGMVVDVDFSAGKVTESGSGKLLVEFAIEPASIVDEYRSGGRNLLIIGRKLTTRAIEHCKKLGIEAGVSAVSLPEPPMAPEGQPFSLAQKLVGKAAGVKGVLPGAYSEPQAHLVFSQDTTGKMTRQELEELACTHFATVFIQSFCHTAAGPRSKDANMQHTLTEFVNRLGGIALKPGDGIIHTNGNRFCLPYFVGTGGDSHTRFPIGISFPAGSDLVAFAASQGYFPLDMPESVLVRFKGEMQPGITIRDLVNAIPYAAMRQGKLNLGKGDAKINVFADRILEIEGLEGITVEDSYKFTDTSAERSAAASAFSHDPERIIEFVRNNLKFLDENFIHRNPSKQIKVIINLMEKWLANPEFLTADKGAPYADIIDVDMSTITEPLLAAPNDPDRIVTLSEAAGTAIDEVFVGSCMTDITDFRAVAKIIGGRQISPTMRFWTVPPDRESNVALADEGVHQALMTAGANVHVPGCSLCMGNQGQVGTGTTVISTSTRNFDNRMGTGAQVYLGSSHVASVCALLGRMPTVKEYMDIYRERVEGVKKQLAVPLAF
ncbi:MAG: bifunctional aconitate hydratase 2/2-methylisocitrate dehydratase [bacterium]|nr:bifunctional aconitate hydratase 2/2-methylisocitrate dehydratase [bacterium]